MWVMIHISVPGGSCLTCPERQTPVKVLAAWFSFEARHLSAVHVPVNHWLWFFEIVS